MGGYSVDAYLLPLEEGSKYSQVICISEDIKTGGWLDEEEIINDDEDKYEDEYSDEDEDADEGGDDYADEDEEDDVGEYY